MSSSSSNDKTSSNETVLAVNSGSSSLKAALIRNDDTHLATFLAEQLGTPNALLHVHLLVDGRGEGETTQELPDCQHEQALEKILDILKQHDLLQHLVCTGHRVVHGGTHFSDSAVVDEPTLQQIQDVSNLAPLHNPHNVAGIQALRRIAPNLPAVAVFDTSFHQTIPPKASLYPLPESYHEQGIRKYGFHGTSVRYVADKAGNSLLGNPNANMIVCHLGNGASITAVTNKQSVETSMGFSPLEGLMMGTRSGSIDPAVVSFAVHALNKTVDDVLNDLNKNSGLKAMAGGESDMRVILDKAKKGSEQAQLAVDMFVYRVVQHIASCAVALPGPVDAIVFTGGIGEHSAEIRRDCMKLLQNTIFPKLEIQDDWNQEDGSQSEGVLTATGSSPICLDVATDEEVMIARDCFRLIHDTERKVD